MSIEPKTSFKRHAAKPLPDYRSARLSVGNETPDDMAHFVAVFHREEEITLLNSMLETLSPPATINGKKLTIADHQAYALAVNHARGTSRNPNAFQIVVEAQTRKASVRFFHICAAAMEAVKAEKNRQFGVTEAHRMAALQAKLELERDTGELPTQKRVKQRAFEIVSLLIKNRKQNFAPYGPEHKRWSKILTSVNLDYLPPAVKGKRG